MDIIFQYWPQMDRYGYLPLMSTSRYAFRDWDAQ